MKVAVLGSGGWGTALAMVLADNGHQVTLWSFFEEESRNLKETLTNPLLPEVTLPAAIHYTSDLSCVAGQEVVVMATPSFEPNEYHQAGGHRVILWRNLIEQNWQL